MPEYEDYGDIESFNVDGYGGYGEGSYYGEDLVERTWSSPSTIIKYIFIGIILLIMVFIFSIPISSLITDATITGGNFQTISPWGAILIRIVPGILILGVITLITTLILVKKRQDSIYY